MERRILVPLAASMTCVALAACGSGSNNNTTTTTTMPLSAQQYKQFLRGLARLGDQAHKALDPILMNPTSLSELQQALKTYAADQGRAAAQASKVTPPANAKAANDQLEKALTDTAAAIRQVLPQVASAGTPKAALAIIQKAKGPQQAGRELDAALAQLQKLGYEKAS
jgi:hypothetical protein